MSVYIAVNGSDHRVYDMCVYTKVKTISQSHRPVVIIIMLSAYIVLFSCFMLKVLHIITLVFWVGAAI